MTLSSSARARVGVRHSGHTSAPSVGGSVPAHSAQMQWPQCSIFGVWACEAPPWNACVQMVHSGGQRSAGRDEAAAGEEEEEEAMVCCVCGGVPGIR